jgi:hypothetical protein
VTTISRDLLIIRNHCTIANYGDWVVIELPLFGMQRDIARLYCLYQETPKCAERVSITNQEFLQWLEQCSIGRLYTGPLTFWQAEITEINAELFKLA